MKVTALIGLLVACGPSGTGSTTGSGSGSASGSASETTPTDEAPKRQLVTVTIVSAEIAGTMPNGQEWDAQDSKSEQTIDKSIALYLKDHPELGDTVEVLGIPIDVPKLGAEAESSVAADPMVLVQIGDAVYRSPMKPRAFNPVWEFPFQFIYDPETAASTNARILIVDYDGPTRFDTIGAKIVPLEDLLGKSVHEFGSFGSVAKLTVEVSTTELPAEPNPQVRRLAVPGNATWIDASIDVTAGQKLTITAADEICFKSKSWCAGPEGLRRAHESSLPGFKKLSHGALIGSIGDTRFMIKRERTLIAPSSGRLRLGINDGNVSNNSGSFAVQVTVELDQ